MNTTMTPRQDFGQALVDNLNKNVRLSVERNNKKITRSTIKSFINREMKNGNLYIFNKSTFDGMVDGVRDCDDRGFRKVVPVEPTQYNLGVQGAWFVGQSRDHFTPYSDNDFIGYEVYNSCGHFIIGMKRHY